MLATDGQKSDLTIHWPRNSRRIDTLIRECRCPVAITPRQVKPGALVALVDDLGRVQLLFRLARIESSANLLAADGVWSGGNYLVARCGTMRRPGPRDPARLPVNRHALGQFAYFDARTRESVLYSQSDNSRSAVALTLATGPAPRKLHPFFANNIGTNTVWPPGWASWSVCLPPPPSLFTLPSESLELRTPMFLHAPADDALC